MSAKKGAVVEWCPLCRVAFVESWPLYRGGHCREVANSGGLTVLLVITSRAVRAHVNVQGQVHRLFSEFCIPLACNHEIKVTCGCQCPFAEYPIFLLQISLAL